jgi:2-(1,2-epoxy-1,2-dihydrophenyl)acetyl-CoA isomerase
MSDEELAPQRIHGEMYGLARTFVKTETPIIVHIDGPVTGLGLGLVAAADVRVASDAATFGLGEPRAAALLLSGGTWLVPAAMGHGPLASMAWAGAVLSARDALSGGFVSRLIDSADGAEELAEGIARMSPAARSAMKRTLNARRVSDMTEQLEYESWLVQVALDRPSDGEGAASI